MDTESIRWHFIPAWGTQVFFFLEKIGKNEKNEENIEETCSYRTKTRSYNQNYSDLILSTKLMKSYEI